MKPGIHHFVSGTRLAFDENISNRVIGEYARSGCIIVYVSPKGTSDDVWVAEAYSRGAEVILSWDLDVGNIIDKENYSGVQWREP